MSRARGTYSRTTLVAAAAVLALLTLGATLGSTAVEEQWARSLSPGPPVAAPGDGFMTTFTFVLGRNIGASALLYSGVMSAGLTSLLSVVLVSAFVGATAKIGVSVSGAPVLLGEVWTYAPLEFAGCALAAVAGVVPAVHALLDRAPGDPPLLVGGRALPPRLSLYVRALPASLRVLGAAVALIILAALIETAIITGR